MNDDIALKAAVDQEIAHFENKVNEYVTFAKLSISDRTDLIAIIMKTANDIISHNRLAALFAVTVVKLAEAEDKLEEAENKLAHLEDELNYWSNR